MKNKFILAVSSLFCLATFAAAQGAPEAAPAQPAPEAAVAAPEPVPAPAPAEEPAPAPEAAPEVVAPAPTQTAEPQAQANESSPVIFYYAPTAQTPQEAAPVQQPAPVQEPVQAANAAPAPQTAEPVQPYKPFVYPKQTMHYGIQGSIGTSEYIGGSNDDLDDGMTWNGGAFVSIPLSDYIFNFELGTQFIYRKVSHSSTQTNKNTYTKDARRDKITAYSLGIPMQVNINASKSGLINFLVGIELEVPLYNNLQMSINGEKRVDQDLHKDYCEMTSWDFILGMGINATKHFGIYTRMNVGISNIYDDLYIFFVEDNEQEYWSFKPFDLSIGLRLFI
ncbi:MAG: PorT family protein [Fibrobacter sp.]|nr:PorT family protein [Fibrobacter sp.]